MGLEGTFRSHESDPPAISRDTFLAVFLNSSFLPVRDYEREILVFEVRVVQMQLGFRD